MRSGSNFPLSFAATKLAIMQNVKHKHWRASQAANARRRAPVLVLTRPLPQFIPITPANWHKAPVAHFGAGIAGLKRLNFLYAVEIDDIAAVHALESCRVQWGRCWGAAVLRRDAR